MSEVSSAEAAQMMDVSRSVLSEIMSTELLTVYEGWSIKRLASFFVKHNISGAPVVASDESLVGVVTQSDVVRFESRSPSDLEIQKLIQAYYGPNTQALTDADVRQLKDRAVENCTVNTIMTPEVLSMSAGTPVMQACSYMVRNDIHRVFVTDQTRLVGVVTAMDMLRNIVQ